MIIANLKEVIGVSVGNTEIKEVWAGDSKVFPTGPEYFYVEHSSTGIIEKILIEDFVNWPSLVTPGNLYGGLFSNWDKKGDYATVIENGQADTLTFVDGKLQDVNYTAYNGDVLAARFKVGNAYTSIQTPVKDTLYYICEIRNEYFKNHVELGYTGTTIDGALILTPIDSNLYTIEQRAKITGTQSETECSVTAVGSVSISRDGTQVSIKAKDLDANIARGYIAYLSSVTYPLSQNTYYEFRGKYTTKDGYEFYTSTIYVYTGSMTTDTFIVSTTPMDYYYIYRTSTNIIERYSATLNPTVNFPAIGGNSYGGVFTDYGGKGTVATAILNGDPVTFVDDRVWDDGSGYAGELTAEGSTEMFAVADAITTGTTAYTPTIGAIYFIREIPDWALRNYRHLTYTGSGSNRQVTNVWLLSGIDSLSYSSFSRKFKEETQSEFEQTSYSVARTMTVPRANGSGTQSINCGAVFRAKGCPTGTGFMAADTTSILSKLEVGKNYIFYYEVETPDGIVVHSPVKFKLVVTSLAVKGITVEEIPWE